jgi:L-lysine exporter family protein LysE/ArgO
LELFVTGFLLSLSLCLDIGIVNIALINTAIRSGTSPALLLGLGSCFGDLFYAVLSLLGIGLLLHYSAVHWGLWGVGSVVLLYLCWDAVRAALRHEATVITDDDSALSAPNRLNLFLRGLTLSLASPTSIIWFAAVGGSLIANSGARSPSGLLALFSGFFSGGFAWCIFITSLSAFGGRALGDKFRRYCSAISALLFLYFAIRLILTPP